MTRFNSHQDKYIDDETQEGFIVVYVTAKSRKPVFTRMWADEVKAERYVKEILQPRSDLLSIKIMNVRVLATKEFIEQ